jgi:hypothetical protein
MAPVMPGILVEGYHQKEGAYIISFKNNNGIIV